MPDIVPIRRALLSVSDKAGLEAFARALTALGVEIISTGGTLAALRSAGIPATGVDHVTGFPEIMDGRVKTLHPAIHGALLGVRDNPGHAAAMAAHAITPIDLVCVNLYPFERTVARPECSHDDAIENIDIGGPSMIRSAAKNHAYVAVLTRPDQYAGVLAEMESAGGTSLRTRERLARDAFSLTARYDSAISAYMSRAEDFPAAMTLAFEKASDLRYGENPHQPAALYRRTGPGGMSIAGAEQVHGKELSYNNILDAQAALSLVQALSGAFPAQHAAAVIKHTNPCGAAIGVDQRTAIDQAIAGDPLAAYGGILAVSGRMTARAAERLNTKEVFLEVVIAPSFDPDALDILRARSAQMRLLAVGEGANADGVDLRLIPGGLLAQHRDTRLAGESEIVLRAGPAPSPESLRAAKFLEPVARSLFSNAVVIGGPGEGGCLRVYGAGAGQMDRVASCRLAVEKAGRLARGAVCFSDAFFPFPDGPTVLIDAGVSAIVHPGGSKRDQDTFDLCGSRGVSCLTTGLRHFRH